MFVKKHASNYDSNSTEKKDGWIGGRDCTEWGLKESRKGHEI